MRLEDDCESQGEVSRRDVLRVTAIAGAGIAVSHLTGCKSESVPTNAAANRAAMAGTVPVKLKINRTVYKMQLEPRVTLLDALREQLAMTGTKKGCDHGQCGACTVLIDDRRVNSCLTLAIAAQETSITTIEGLADGDDLHPVQAAFIKHDGFQCGYCTPGQICSAVGLIKEGRCKSDDDIRENMAGNICRCGAYVNIVDAVREAMTA